MELFSGVSDPVGYGLAVVMFGGWLGLFWVTRLVLTGKLCSGRELKAMEKQRDDWQRIALTGLGVAERTTAAAEILHDVAEVLPDPAREGRP